MTAISYGNRASSLFIYLFMEYKSISSLLIYFIVSDGVEKPTYIKFLVSNAEAGSVIGKGGSTITDFQSQSGARIQLSRNQEFFPGTSDRIIVVSGAVNEIIKAMELILMKLMSEVNSTR